MGRLLRYLPLLVILAPSAAFGAPADKVTICHWANGNAHSITISSNALDGHFDAETGKPVPGHEADTLGECPLPTEPTPEVINDPIFPPPPGSPEVPDGGGLPVSGHPGHPDPSGTNCVDGAGRPYQTSYAACPDPLESPIPGATAPGGPSGTPGHELPRTGLGLEWAVGGILLILLGGSLWSIGRI